MIANAERKMIPANGIELETFVAGSGTPVVLCHGFPELAFSWRHQVGPLAEAGYRVIVPNQRGFGASSAPPEVEAYDLDSLAGDVVGLLDALGEPRAIVIGHDWGAPVAWHTALRHPERVMAVASLSVPHARRGSVPPLLAMRAAAGPGFVHYVDYFQTPGVAENEFEHDVRSGLLGFLWSISGDAPKEERFRPIPAGGRFIDSITVPKALPPWLSEEDLSVYVKAFEASGFRGGLNWYRNVMRNWQRSADLSEARVLKPALFITGSRDPARNPGAIAQLAEVVPNLAATHVLEGCGHWTQQERPEQVNQLLLEWLLTVVRQ